MFEIISPDQYKVLPWKNGKGETIELAINNGGTLENFDWRLSIANVIEDGEFSDFSGYNRNLVLIKGQGITLQHDELLYDRLEQQLSVATFDGGLRTQASLISGPITDFNLMTKSNTYHGSIDTFPVQQETILKAGHLCFIYGLDEDIKIASRTEPFVQIVPAGHLIKISDQNTTKLTVSGKNMIIVYLTHI